MSADEKSFKKKSQSPEALSRGERLTRLRRLLDEFVFFHLGSDACVEVQESAAGGALVSFTHKRIRSFQWEIEPPELDLILSDRDLLENRLMTQLTRHRRS